MYEWDPEGGFHNAVWSGTLVIDRPCVYLDVSHQDGKPVRGGETRLSFVRLPEPLTRLDAATGKLLGRRARADVHRRRSGARRQRGLATELESARRGHPRLRVRVGRSKRTLRPARYPSAPPMCPSTPRR